MNINCKKTLVESLISVDDNGVWKYNAPIPFNDYQGALENIKKYNFEYTVECEWSFFKSSISLTTQETLYKDTYIEVSEDRFIENRYLQRNTMYFEDGFVIVILSGILNGNFYFYNGKQLKDRIEWDEMIDYVKNVKKCKKTLDEITDGLGLDYDKQTHQTKTKRRM